MKKSNLITMIISLLAAILLWVYVVTIVNPAADTTLTCIPVTKYHCLRAGEHEQNESG